MDVPDRSIGCHQHPVRACPRQDPSCLSPTTAGTGSSLRLQWQTPIERAVGIHRPADPRFPVGSLWISMSSFWREPPAGDSGSRDPFHSRPLTPRSAARRKPEPAPYLAWSRRRVRRRQPSRLHGCPPKISTVEWVSANSPRSNGCLQNLQDPLRPRSQTPINGKDQSRGSSRPIDRVPPASGPGMPSPGSVVSLTDHQKHGLATSAPIADTHRSSLRNPRSYGPKVPCRFLMDLHELFLARASCRRFREPRSFPF